MISRKTSALLFFSLAAAGVSVAPAFAQQAGLPAFTSSALPGGGQSYSLSIQTLLLLTTLTFLPAVLMMMTGFTRIIIVLSLLRQALGTQSSPPNQVMVGLALFLTFFVMSPVIDQIHDLAYKPFSENRISMNDALEKGSEPLKAFMLRQTRQADLALFVKISNTRELQDRSLIIDMVVASVLMSMGMMMLSPVIISLPFKIMLFVLVDGWHLLVGSLVQSFST